MKLFIELRDAFGMPVARQEVNPTLFDLLGAQLCAFKPGQMFPIEHRDGLPYDPRACCYLYVGYVANDGSEYDITTDPQFSAEAYESLMAGAQ